jgi:hypothetical protein
MMETIYLEPSQVPNHLKGGYSGKMFRARVCESVTIPADAGLWSSGSRDTYQAIELATGRAVEASDNMSAPWSSERKERTIALRSGYAVVEAITFQGKDLGLVFYVHPDDANKLLPASDDEVTPTERKVLAIIGGLKSSYRKEYFDRAGIKEPELEAIKSNLINRGYLTKVGAITPKGRNARGNVQPY